MQENIEHGTTPTSEEVVATEVLQNRPDDTITKSRSGGSNTEAYQIASALYGGHPPAEYVERVRQGLAGEDH